MSKTTAGLAAWERKASIMYQVGFDQRTFEGWISQARNGRDVAARKLRGRNTWLLCNAEDVIDIKWMEG